jgi:hypothetical protein
MSQIDAINKTIEDKRKLTKTYKKHLEKQLTSINQYLDSLTVFKIALDERMTKY